MTRTPTPSSSMPPSARTLPSSPRNRRQRRTGPLCRARRRGDQRERYRVCSPRACRAGIPRRPGKRGGTRICNACRSRAARCRARRSSRVLRSTPEHACAVALCDARADGCRAAAGRRSRRPRNRRSQPSGTSPTSSRETMPTPSPPATPPRSMSRPWRQSSKIPARP